MAESAPKSAKPPPPGRVACVTGAFSNIGQQTAIELAGRGWTVRTLTNRAPSGPLAGIAAHPLVFDRARLEAALAGADVLVNTYWVRLPGHGADYDEAVANSHRLIEAALAAGVSRVVQVSVTHARLDSPSPYYAGKARVDAHVAARCRSWATVHPTLVVGPKDVLTGNMAWFVRRSPLVLLPRGAYPLQPVTLADVGRIVADAAESEACGAIEAAGPDRWTFRHYIELLARALGRRAVVVEVPESIFVAVMALAGLALRDDIVTADEIRSLGRGSLVPEGPATGAESVADWLMANAAALGGRYVNDRRARRRGASIAAGRPAPPAGRP